MISGRVLTILAGRIAIVAKTTFDNPDELRQFAASLIAINANRPDWARFASLTEEWWRQRFDPLVPTALANLEKSHQLSNLCSVYY